MSERLASARRIGARSLLHATRELEKADGRCLLEQTCRDGRESCTGEGKKGENEHGVWVYRVDWRAIILTAPFFLCSCRIAISPWTEVRSKSPAALLKAAPPGIVV